MPRLICVQCQHTLKPEKNGIIVVEMFQQNTAIYKLWEADVWRCPKCKNEVVAGFAKYPLMEHWQGNIGAFFQRLRDAGHEFVREEEIIT